MALSYPLGYSARRRSTGVGNVCRHNSLGSASSVTLAEDPEATLQCGGVVGPSNVRWCRGHMSFLRNKHCEHCISFYCKRLLSLTAMNLHTGQWCYGSVGRHGTGTGCAGHWDCAATCVMALIGADCFRCTNLSFASFFLSESVNTLLRLLLVLHWRGVFVIPERQRRPCRDSSCSTITSSKMYNSTNMACKTQDPALALS